MATNFLQNQGLRPGPNVLAFQLERYGQARVRSAMVLDDSGVVSSHRGPAHLRLDVPVRDRELRVGDAFVVPYVIRNTADRRPERISIAVQYDKRVLTAIGATERRLDRRAKISHGRFRFRAARAGSTRVLLAVQSTANRPGAEIAVRIDRPTAAGGRVRLVERAARGRIRLAGGRGGRRTRSSQAAHRG